MSIMCALLCCLPRMLCVFREQITLLAADLSCWPSQRGEQQRDRGGGVEGVG